MHQEPNRLRVEIQAFIRRFGLLNENQTPCGKPLGKSHAHALMIMLERERAGDEITPTVLARLLGIDKSNGTRLCRRLVTLKQAKADGRSEDRRVVALSLTPQGRRLAVEVENASVGFFKSLLAGIPQSARSQVLEAFQHLNSALEKEITP